MSTNAKTRYNISKVFGPAVPDKGSKDSDPSADNMAGIAINGKTAYCAKRSQTSSNIFVIENIASASFDALNGKTPVSIPYAVHGMTYHNNYLYMPAIKTQLSRCRFLLSVKSQRNILLQKMAMVTFLSLLLIMAQLTMKICLS